jgi:hypothetical protein
MQVASSTLVRCISVALALRDSGLIVDRKYHLQTYRQCFVGSEFVDWLLKLQLVPDRKAAVAVGQDLLDQYFIHHVACEHGFEDDYFFYRLYDDDDILYLTRMVRAMNCFQQFTTARDTRLNHNAYEFDCTSTGTSRTTTAFLEHELGSSLQRLQVFFWNFTTAAPLSTLRQPCVPCLLIAAN